ncbi:MAG: hypothetical protein WCK92_07215 [Bacteroidota bacterium]
MRTILKITVLFLMFLPAISRAESKDIPFTLDDRDRIIRTEQKLEALKTEMKIRFDANDKRFENIDKRFDQLFNFLWAIIGIFTTMMVSVFGFAFWDRKLSLAPLKREDEKLKSVLREFSRSQPKLAEILKNAGML